MAYTENFNLNKQLNSNNYPDGFKASFAHFPMLPNGRFIALPFLIFLLWIFLSMLTQFTFINGVNNNAAASSGIAGMKKSPASTTLVYNGSSKGYNPDLIQKGVFVLRNSK